jgi:hypothetical protein
MQSASVAVAVAVRQLVQVVAGALVLFLLVGVMYLQLE